MPKLYPLAFLPIEEIKALRGSLGGAPPSPPGTPQERRTPNAVPGMLYGNSDFSHEGPGKFPFQAKIPTKIPSLL